MTLSVRHWPTGTRLEPYPEATGFSGLSFTEAPKGDGKLPDWERRHEPDDGRPFCTESVRARGCNSGPLLTKGSRTPFALHFSARQDHSRQFM